jgi:hypothetical protein
MKFLSKKEVVPIKILRTYLIHVFKKCLLGEAILGFKNFILAFFILFIVNNLLQLIQQNHADGLNVERIMNK